jgi:3-hydroxyisobutyrate dehydrogenase-like beta-hydroxyacid dehydrogenase
MTDSDGSIRQIVIVIITAVVVSALSFVSQAALKPDTLNPYIEDRKLINASIVDLKAEMVIFKHEMKLLREELRRINPYPRP